MNKFIVPKIQRKKAKNVAMLLLHKNMKNEYRILVVRDKFKKKWMIPAGGINRHKKEGAFRAVSREFYEETTIKLSYFITDKFMEYYYQPTKTLFFIGFTRKSFPKGGIGTTETDKIDHINAKNFYNNISKLKGIKGYVRKSYIEVINYLAMYGVKFAIKILK
tara:strand:+ start:873 stop:1361 length:489 start_codon:yes stop_codon:yes gene_type:complete